MTLDEIIASDKTMLSPGDIAEVPHSDKHTIRETAKQMPDRMKIPKDGFLRWYEGLYL